MADRLGELLVQSGVLDRPTLERARGEQQRRGGTLGRILVGSGMVGEDTYVRALSRQLQLPAVALDPAKIAGAVVRVVPRETCDRYGLVPFRLDRQRGLLDLAMSDATQNEAIDTVESQTQLKVRPFVAGPRAVDRVLEAHSATGPEQEAVTPTEPTPRPTAVTEAQRINDLEEAVRRLESLVLSLVSLLVEGGKVDRAELGRRMANSGGGR